MQLAIDYCQSTNLYYVLLEEVSFTKQMKLVMAQKSKEEIHFESMSKIIILNYAISLGHPLV
jgi:hypothetical protein